TFCIKLSPSFIKRNPCYNGCMVIKLINHVFKLIFKINGRLCRSVDVVIIGPDVAVAIRHILPYQHGHFVGPVVPAVRCNRYVLANLLEATLFPHPDITCTRSSGGCRIDAVRPQPLSKQSIMTQRLATYKQARKSIGALPQSTLAHTKITFYFIYVLVTI